MIRPIGHRVLLQPCRKPEKSDGGIVIPRCADDNMQSQFIVRSVAESVKDVLPGQRVYCNTYAGTPVEVNGRLHRIVDRDSILAILSCG